MQEKLIITQENNKLLLSFNGELTLYEITKLQKQISDYKQKNITTYEIDLQGVSYIDTAVALFLLRFEENRSSAESTVVFTYDNEKLAATLALVKSQRQTVREEVLPPKKTVMQKLTKKLNSLSSGIISFMSFFGQLVLANLHYLKSIKNIRFKEIAFEMNESAIKAIGIVSLTSFLIGLVVAYQSAFQLKSYGANIFIVDMLGISILRELAPLITAIVIAGRSGSAFTAQIGAMKITQELDAMKSMGFDPFAFLVMPRIIALMITLPILIFIADIMGMLGGMIVSNLDLGITSELFLDRFREVVAVKHFYIGILKGPFFAFLIASIGIYRGLVVKDDTQSIGFNTTKSVVESIFAVIVCDALFSIIFTNLGI